MWYAVLLLELHYRSLWASVTTRVWGKLHHYVPGENEILLSSCTLEVILSQTVWLIKSSQFRLEFLSQFFSVTELKKKMCECISNLILLGILCKQLVYSDWHVHCTWITQTRMLQDAQCHLRQTQPTSTATKAGGCVSAVYHLYDWVFVFVSLLCNRCEVCWSCFILLFFAFQQHYWWCLLLCFHCLGLRCFDCLISSVCILDPHFLPYNQTWNLRLPLGSALVS